jgi:hypothetical protein
MRKWTWRYEGVGAEVGSGEGRRFVASLAVSLAILAGGIGWTLHAGKESNKLFHRLAHAEEALDGIRRVASAAPQTKGHAQ